MDHELTAQGTRSLEGTQHSNPGVAQRGNELNLSQWFSELEGTSEGPHLYFTDTRITANFPLSRVRDQSQGYNQVFGKESSLTFRLVEREKEKQNHSVS